ncbi:MAG: rRNA maturation RNase YbeY [Pirellulales bacterium]
MAKKTPYRVALHNAQQRLAVDRQRLIDVVRQILIGEGFARGDVSLAIVDDPTIHQLNRQYLDHDYATDVLSFLLDETADPRGVEGEVIVSADTALQSAASYGWEAADELLLYVVHGTLHLTGYDDQTPELQQQMRERERYYLARFGLAPRY